MKSKEIIQRVELKGMAFCRLGNERFLFEQKLSYEYLIIQVGFSKFQGLYFLISIGMRHKCHITVVRVFA